MSAILAAGAYVPRFRIDADEYRTALGRFDASGVESTAVPDADEDTVTMGYEAARRAFRAGSIRGNAIEWLAFASSNPPLAEGELTAALGAMLDVPETSTSHTFTGSTRAGTRALWAAQDAIDVDDGPATALVIVADAPRGSPDDGLEHASGAGAVAFVVGPNGPARIVDRAEYTSPYPGTRFRRTGESRTRGLGVRAYDRRAFVETLAGAVDGIEAEGPFDAVAIQAPDGKLPYRVASAIDVDSAAVGATQTVSTLGDTGAASVPLGIVRGLESSEVASILAASFGSGGGADALVLSIDDPVPVDTDALPGDGTGSESIELTYPEYLRRTGILETSEPSGGGAYVSVPTWRRSIPQRYRLEAGRCISCTSLVFPPTGACPDCGSREPYETIRLSGRGSVAAVTTISQGGAPPEFTTFQTRTGDYEVAIVDFDGPNGESASAPVMLTGDANDVAVGDRVEATIRRIYTQEGVTRYGVKVGPVD